MAWLTLFHYYSLLKHFWCPKFSPTFIEIHRLNFINSISPLLFFSPLRFACRYIETVHFDPSQNVGKVLITFAFQKFFYILFITVYSSGRVLEVYKKLLKCECNQNFTYLLWGVKMIHASISRDTRYRSYERENKFIRLTISISINIYISIKKSGKFSEIWIF